MSEVRKLITYNDRIDLYDSVIKGDISMVKSLINAGCTINRQVKGHNALYYAIKKAHVDIAILLIDAGIEIEKDILILAIKEKLFNLCIYLIKNKNVICNTILLFPVSYQLGIVAIEHGAKTNIKNKFGNYPIEIQENFELIKLLHSKGCKCYSLYNHIKNNRTDIVKFLMENGTKFKDDGVLGYVQDLQLARYLMSKNISVREKSLFHTLLNKRLDILEVYGRYNPRFDRLYSFIIREDYEFYIRYLNSRGYNFNIKNPQLLLDTFEINDYIKLEFLLNIGMKMETNNILLYASRNNYPKVAEVCLKHGIKPDMNCWVSGSYHIRKLLLEYGLDPNDGFILHDRVRLKDKFAISLLVDFGADADLKDTNGNSPKDYANGDKEILELLSPLPPK